MGIGDLLIDFYKKGGLVIGNSAGAMIMFEKVVSDYKIMAGISNSYEVADGYGLIKGCFCPHSNEQSRLEFIKSQDLNCILLKENEYLKFE